MSFFDTLQAMGLFPNRQPQAQAAPGQPPSAAPASQDPYALSPEMRRMLGWQTLGNVSQQLLALSQQMTPRQRAEMMQNVDFSGGYAQNLANAQQMMLAQREASRKELEYQRTEDARKTLADQIKQLPKGRLRDAAMYFFQSGDLAKVGELLYTRKKVYDPLTMSDRYEDALGNPVDGPGPGSGAMAPGGGYSAPGSPASSPAAPGAIPPATGAESAGGTGEPSSDPVVNTYRRIFQDPSLTPAEVRILATQNSREAAGKAYQDILQRRQSAAQAQASQDQARLSNDRQTANQIRSDFQTAAKGYDTVIAAGERGAAVAQNPAMTPADKLSVLYDFVKTLDPLGSVRDSDVELAQSIQPLVSRLEQMYRSMNEGGTITNEAVVQIARSMARLANDAQARKLHKRQELQGVAEENQIKPSMVFGPSSKNQNIQKPTGWDLPPASALDAPVQLTPEDDSFVNSFFSGGGN